MHHSFIRGQVRWTDRENAKCIIRLIRAHWKCSFHKRETHYVHHLRNTQRKSSKCLVSSLSQTYTDMMTKSTIHRSKSCTFPSSIPFVSFNVTNRMSVWCELCRSLIYISCERMHQNCECFVFCMPKPYIIIIIGIGMTAHCVWIELSILSVRGSSCGQIGLWCK